MQPIQSNTSTGNPQQIGGAGILQQQGNLQPTADANVFKTESSDIKLNIDATGQDDLAAYVQQQAAPKLDHSSPISLFWTIGAAVLALAVILWYIGWRTEKQKSNLVNSKTHGRSKKPKRSRR